MSNTVKNPNEKSNGFVIAIIALVAIIAAVVGYILVQGNKAESERYADREMQSVSVEGALDGSAVKLSAADVKKDAPVVELYEDFSCPHCADLAEATDAEMLEALEAGDFVVEIRTLNFLDRGEDRNAVEGHSTLAGHAVWTIINSGDVELYWNYRALLMEEQSTIYGQWTQEDFAKVAEQLGASEDVVNQIATGANMDAFRKAAIANAEKLEKDTGTVSSPRVIVDGTEIESDIQNWVSQARS